MRRPWRTLPALALLALLVTRPAAAQGGFHVMVDQFGSNGGDYGTWGTNIGLGLHAPLGDNRWFSPAIDIDFVPATGGAKTLYFPLTGTVNAFLTDPKGNGAVLPWVGFGYSCIVHLGGRSTRTGGGAAPGGGTLPSSGGGYTSENVCSNVIVGGVAMGSQGRNPWYVQVQYWTNEDVPRVALAIHVPVF